MRFFVVAIVLGACAAPAGVRAPSAGPPSAFMGPPPAEPSAQVPPAAPNAEPLAPAPNAAAPSAAAPSSTVAPPGPPERHGPALPELSVKSFGLHVGGGSADAAARGDFLRALEAGSSRYLDCYRLIEQPGSVGTFGADLTIGGAGGKPKVGKPRTKLRGEAFQACMVRAFESASFGPPPSGRAVVVSYSVKFNFGN